MHINHGAPSETKTKYDETYPVGGVSLQVTELILKGHYLR